MLRLFSSPTIVTLWSWMVCTNRSTSTPLPPSCRGLGQPYMPVDNSAYANLQMIAGRGLLGSAIMCARFARAGFPRGRGGIVNAAFRWLVLWMVVVACLTLACPSIAWEGGQWRRRVHCCCTAPVRTFPLRGHTCRIDRRETLGGAAASHTVPSAELEILFPCFFLKAEHLANLFSSWNNSMLCALVLDEDPTADSDDMRRAF